MKPDDARVLELLAAVLKLKDQAEVDDFLSTACEGDQELLEKVLALLEVSRRPDTSSSRKTEQEIGPGDETLIATLLRSEMAGTFIDRYKLLEQIGEGGMGTVWMAEQTEPVQRRVALKVIRYGAASPNVFARFAAERQALALMDHPNIAKVLDAGTTPTGRPYFVMELVRGTPITSFCDQKRLTIQQRLGLFIPVCQAMQHAHQKGIIHRDIKPSNVLVALYDDRPTPKVIDFGIAKALGQPLTERTLFTELGALVGTPEYMSPEQAELNQVDVDTRCDVYSLGVLLYELLTGTTPLTREAFRQAAFDEILRRIRTEEPAKPSTRLSDSRDRLSTISTQRKLQPARLLKLVRGDLDRIVMKALEKDRARRYETANGLAADIVRFLKHEPVTAVAPSAGYRLRKLMQRNRTKVALAAATVMLFAVGIVLSTGLSLLLTRQRNSETQPLPEQSSKVDAAKPLNKAEGYQPELSEEGRNRMQKAEQASATGGVPPTIAYPAQARTSLSLGEVGSAPPGSSELDGRGAEGQLRQALPDRNQVPSQIDLNGAEFVTGGVLLLKGSDAPPFLEALSGFRDSCPEVPVLDSSNSREFSTQLSSHPPSLIVAVGRQAAEIAHSQAPAIPLMLLMVRQPATLGLTGQNIAGVSMDIPGDIQLTRFKELLPDRRVFVLIYNPTNNSTAAQEAKAVAQGIQVQLQFVKANSLASHKSLS
jgi:serine/threonine protein kinase